MLIDAFQGKLAIYELMTEDSAVNFWDVSSLIANIHSFSDINSRNMVMSLLTLVKRRS